MKPIAPSLIIVCWSLAGCPDRPIDRVDPVQTGVYVKSIPVSVDIDLLFVIDNSGSTRDKQELFAANFINFVDALDRFPSGRPNLHIGVVSSSVDVGADVAGDPDDSCHPASGHDGLLQSAPNGTSCTLRDRFLSDVQLPDGTRATNYPGDLTDAFRCAATLGDQGCGFEAPLEAMKRALDGRHPANRGFVRDHAHLAVVFLTDEDDASVRDPRLFALPASEAGPGDFRAQPLHAYDCDRPISATAPGTYTGCRVRRDSLLADPAGYARFLASVKDPGLVVAAVIGGDPRTAIATGPLDGRSLALLPSCSVAATGAIARPAIRLTDFLDSFGSHGLFRTVCQADYSQALTDIGDLLFKVISPCLEGSLDTGDTDPANPGIQPTCAVSDLTPLGDGELAEAIIPACAMADPTTPAAGAERPCWWVQASPTACGATPTQLELHVERTAPPATGGSVRVSCATAR